MITYLIDINFKLNNLNRLQGGVFMIIFGFVFTLAFRYFHKKYQNEGYKPFKPFRREGKTQVEDSLFIFLYMRSLVGVYIGYLIILGGIICIIAYFR
jgi:hypothetical protein